MIGSALSYVALRLLGEGADDDNAVIRGREWILDHGGATGIPSWGKTYLSVYFLFKFQFGLLYNIFNIAKYICTTMRNVTK